MVRVRHGFCPHRRHSACIGRDDQLLAGMGLSRGRRRIRCSSDAFYNKRSDTSRKQNKGWPDCGATTHSKDYSVVHGLSGYRCVHYSRPGPSFRMVERAIMALHSRRPPDYSESLDGLPGIQRKLFWLHDRRDHHWPKSDHHRPLRHRTQSDVFKRCGLLYRSVLGARFLLGAHRFCPRDLRPRLEAV